MKIIIPMVGSSTEFDKDGLGSVKPLVKIDEKTMIEHTCSVFPNKSDFIFLCKKEHLENTNMEIVLKKISPKCKIVSVSQETSGPAETVLFADGLIEEGEEVVISYCDYFIKWDFWKFVDEPRKNNADGCMAAFTGFHPASLSKRQYSYINVNDESLVTEVKEKEPFNDTMSGYTSAGVYYFSKWSLFKKYSKQMIDKNIRVNNTYFVSLVYNQIIKDGLRVVPYIVDRFICFGEPENVKEYIFWSSYFSSLNNQNKRENLYSMINLIPMAGLGKRFSDAGYKDPKPLIKVLNKPMSILSALSLPKAEKYIFVCLRDHIEWFGLDKLLKKSIPNSEIIAIDNATDGMARSCLAAERSIDSKKPLLISSCDYSFVYSDEKFQNLLKEEDPDVVIWTFKEYPDARRNPKAYAYLVVQGNKVKSVSEKAPISDTPNKDPIVQGVFYFKTAGLFLKCAKDMILKKKAVNGEYYVATAINELISEGKKVVPFTLDKYICWGTPEDLKIFQYWESYFKNLEGHSYNIN